MDYCVIEDIIVKDENKVSVFVLDDRLIEIVDAESIGAPMIIYYGDGDVYVYDDVVSFEQTDAGFWVETETLMFRFENYYEESEDDDSLDWDYDDEMESHMLDEFDF